MKPFTARRTIFIFSSSRSFSINPFPRAESNLYARLQLSHFSSSSSNSVAFRRHEEESRNVRVSVWWDFENCSPSAGGNNFKIAQNITSAVRASGINGPIQITAFGDMMQLSRTNQEALSATGINLTHIPHGGKNSADRSLLVDLMYWVSQNPPPSHIFLISGDRDFANTLHRLRMNNYNILLASPENSPGVLCSAASIMWNWNSIVKGDNLTGKYFNQPPDGPYGSWYGYYKFPPLEDPFAVHQQSSSPSPSTQSEELSDSCQEQNLLPVPKAVSKQVRRILRGYPKGIHIIELREELSKTEVPLDKDLYGYKKFSRFLLSLPDIKLSGSDGCFFVRIPQKLCEPAEGPLLSNSDDLNLSVSTKGNGKDNKLSISTDAPMKEKIEQKEVEPTKEEGDNKLGMKVESNCQSKLQVLKKLGNSLEGNSANSTAEETNVRSVNQDIAARLVPASSSLSDNGEAKDGKVSEPGFFKKFTDWFMFWRTDSSTDILNEDSCKTPKKASVDDDQVKNKTFSSDTFWTEMERFLDTSHGSDIVLLSKGREEFAENLKKEGPSILNSLSTSDLLHLLHLIITEKKWVQECISQPYPFKLVKPITTPSHNTSSSNGLSLMFMSPPKESESDNPKPLEKSRNDVLADCQKLADDIVNGYPDGFQMGSFRKFFILRFGYPLDFQKLGYQNLVTLLQIMPGVKVESNVIYPLNKRNANGKLSDSLRKDGNDIDSQWEDFGPVAAKDSQTTDDYDSLAVEELISDDSEEETTSSSLVESSEKSGNSLNKEDSSLIKILDSWYSKNGDNGKGGGAESLGNVDGSTKDSPAFTFFGGNSSGRKQRPTKTYSFVSEKEDSGSRDKLIDGILGSLKKSGESRIHS
ncbi:uncharacterized protein LOC124937676 [Impatiens glandulifera]|uniref:uncharacterized protein LOC124937676 n=1 Tax=Impatiens glandulifera TaxID=253017 RepID=UPI001FB09433|nr:uncharacterized protein LOC124937676 [Impatiens glandulifera]